MKIERLEVSIYRIPTDRPEADGTFQWDSTTLVLVEAVADSGLRGLGFSYTATAAGELIHDLLSKVVIGHSVEHIGAAWQAMISAVRNIGEAGIAATAISAVDTALWDLRARAVEVPLFHLLGVYRESVPIYGSGGFTTYSEAELVEQLAGWVDLGISKVKMKVGKDWGTKQEEDLARVRAVRRAIGPVAELFVDANGAYTPKQAIDLAKLFAEQGVTYFEEPVLFDHLDQLAFIRQHSPIAIASGEYGYNTYDFRNVLEAKAVDILQIDATRCLGITGSLQAAALAHAFGVPLSTHTAPSIHAHVGCAIPQIEHLEYFHDHVRIENMLFEGVLQPQEGYLRPDPNRPGLGLELKVSDAQRWRISKNEILKETN
jgi:L-alanine-DL-glutamate epimerase-like enolase superfamily enzyme